MTIELFNLFHANVLCLYLLKTLKNQSNLAFSGGIEIKHYQEMS